MASSKRLKDFTKGYALKIVSILFLILNSCVSVDKNHWAWCLEQCESLGGLSSASFNSMLEVSCECEDGSMQEHDRVQFEHYPPEEFEIYENEKDYDFD